MDCNSSGAQAPITDKSQLLAYMAEGCKPPAEWLIGTEHEKFAFYADSLEPLAYEGPNGVRAVLEALATKGWTPVLENGQPIALTKEDMSSVTLEPGGQIELSSAPLKTIHQTCAETRRHLAQMKEVAEALGIAVMGLGYLPKARLDDIPWMPKSRYAIMRRYMPTKGALGLDMMLATATVQVNLDFSTEQRMVRMFRVALALQPLATALWANSPFKEGRKTGYLSYRSHIWTDTDADRCGMLPFVLEDGFGFERYVDYMLGVPMYFVRREGEYIDAAGQSFSDFMAGRLPALPGERPTLSDWEDHLTTVFPEVRLKRFLEMRGADGGGWGNICALPAFWVGLLYDDQALADAERLIGDWSPVEISRLRDEVPRHALGTRFRKQTVRDLALEALRLARQGLTRRARLDGSGQNETHFLHPLNVIAESGVTQAEEMIAAFDGEWRGSVDPIFEKYAY